EEPGMTGLPVAGEGEIVAVELVGAAIARGEDDLADDGAHVVAHAGAALHVVAHELIELPTREPSLAAGFAGDREIAVRSAGKPAVDARELARPRVEVRQHDRAARRLQPSPGKPAPHLG